LPARFRKTHSAIAVPTHPRRDGESARTPFYASAVRECQQREDLAHSRVWQKDFHAGFPVMTRYFECYFSRTTVTTDLGVCARACPRRKENIFHTRWPWSGSRMVCRRCRRNLRWRDWIGRRRWAASDEALTNSVKEIVGISTRLLHHPRIVAMFDFRLLEYKFHSDLRFVSSFY
jgi:hypothetical protein